MAREDMLPQSDAAYKNRIYDCIKNKNIMVQKWSEEIETYITIIVYPDIIHGITSYIGNIKDLFVLAVENNMV